MALELYHNAASTCSQKLRLVLAEKGLDWESHDVDLIDGAILAGTPGTMAYLAEGAKTLA